MLFKAFLICFVVYIGCANGESKPLIKFSEVETKRVIDAVMKCIPSSGLSIEEFALDVKESRYKDDRSYHELIYCAFKNANYVGPNGHINLDRAVSLFPKDVPMREILSECNKETGKDDVETVFLYYKCFLINSPVAVEIA